MNTFSEYSVSIEKFLRGLSLPGGELSSLYEPVAYAMSAGGKRLRPALVLMAADAFGRNRGGTEGVSVEKAMRSAAGIEMFHNFTLLHDDVMDNSDTRRGRPSVHAKWDVNTAILSGDTMLTLATQLVADVDDSILRRVLDTFNEMAIRVYEGQRLDMDFEESDDVTIDDYLRMIMDKTGALLGASAKIGAIIGGASGEDCERMYEYGMMLGVAFQIQDDWLDVFGDSSTFGKPIGGDINNNKKSFLLLSGLAGARAESEALAEAMRLPSGDTKVKTVTRLYERMGLSDECRDAIARYSSKALGALRGTAMSDTDKEMFRKLAEKLTGRKK